MTAIASRYLGATAGAALTKWRGLAERLTRFSQEVPAGFVRARIACDARALMQTKARRYRTVMRAWRSWTARMVWLRTVCGCAGPRAACPR
jgi:hypothetical protein